MLGLGNTLLGGAVSAEFTAASISSLDLWYDFSTLTGSDGDAGDQNHIQLAGANGVAIQTRFTGTSGGSANNLVTTKTNGTESTGTNGDGDHTFRENTPEILVMTRDASEANRFFNFEGTLICTSTSATNNNSNTNFRVGNIGADGDGGGAHQGTIGEVGVYNKVLSADEISSLITHLASKWSVS